MGSTPLSVAVLHTPRRLEGCLLHPMEPAAGGVDGDQLIDTPVNNDVKPHQLPARWLLS